MNETASGHPDDDLAVYAVEALEAHQRHAIDTHLVQCARCRTHLNAYLETLAALSTDEDPPPQIWDHISAQIATGHRPTQPRPPGAVTPVATPPQHDTRPAAQPRHPRHPDQRAAIGARVAAALAAAALVATVVGIGITQLRSQLGSDSVTELARAALDDPSSALVALTDPSSGRPAARLVIDASEQAYVLFDELPRLPAEQTYQLWRTEGTTPVSLGVLGTGTAEAIQVALPAGPARLAISREPAGGSAAPTGPLVAAGSRS